MPDPRIIVAYRPDCGCAVAEMSTYMRAWCLSAHNYVVGGWLAKGYRLEEMSRGARPARLGCTHMARTVWRDPSGEYHKP